MKTKKLGNQGLTVPALGLGCMGMSEFYGARDDHESIATIHRALAAVRFLTERAGLDPHRVGAVGYGEYRPVADNSTPEGRARNRRIAITILPDELAGADTVPPGPAGAAPNTSTNVPPVVPPAPASAAGQ